MASSTNPLSGPVVPHAFDPLLCDSLHIQIMAILKPFAEKHNNHVVHNFFVAYGDEAAAMRDRLSEPIITFLVNIEIILSHDSSLTTCTSHRIWQCHALLEITWHLAACLLHRV